MPEHGGDLWIANTVSDLILGHVPGLGSATRVVNRLVLEVRV